jgi:chromate transporter
MARKNNNSIWAWLLTGTTLVLVAFLRVSPIWILLVLIVLAAAYSYYKEKRTE